MAGAPQRIVLAILGLPFVFLLVSAIWTREPLVITLATLPVAAIAVLMIIAGRRRPVDRSP